MLKPEESGNSRPWKFAFIKLIRAESPFLEFYHASCHIAPLTCKGILLTLTLQNDPGDFSQGGGRVAQTSSKILQQRALVRRKREGTRERFG